MLAGLGGLGAFGAAGLAGVGRALAQSEVVADELRVISHRCFYGLHPVHEFSAWYLHGLGVGECLAQVTPSANVEPLLAQSYRQLDPYTWLVELRPGAAFWSGAPVDAAAVVASLERSRALAPLAAGQLRGIRVEPEAEWTVRFASDAPIPGLPYNLADAWLMVHNAAAYGPADNAFDLGVADLTGFFRPTAFQSRNFAQLERNERHLEVVPFVPLLEVDYVTAVHRSVRNYIPHFLLWGPNELHPDIWSST